MFNSRVRTLVLRKERMEAIFIEPSPGLTLPLGEFFRRGGAYEIEVENRLLLRTSQKIQLALRGKPQVGTATVDNITERVGVETTIEKRERLGTCMLRLAKKKGRYVLTREKLEYPPGGDDIPKEVKEDRETYKRNVPSSDSGYLQVGW